MKVFVRLVDSSQFQSLTNVTKNFVLHVAGVLDTCLVKFITEQTGLERNQSHAVVLVSLMLRSDTHILNRGLFIIRRTSRSHALSMLEMPSLCSDHTSAKHLTVKVFLLYSHIISCFYRATHFDLTQYHIQIYYSTNLSSQSTIALSKSALGSLKKYNLFKV